MSTLRRIISRIISLEIQNYCYHEFGRSDWPHSWKIHKRLLYIRSLERQGFGSFSDGNSETHKIVKKYDEKHFSLRG